MKAFVRLFEGKSGKFCTFRKSKYPAIPQFIPNLTKTYVWLVKTYVKICKNHELLVQGAFFVRYILLTGTEAGIQAV